MVMTARGRALAASELSCPAGNLLAGARPVAVAGISEDSLTSVVTDGFALQPGSPLGSLSALRFVPDEPRFLLFDLGRPVPLRTIYVQGDSDDVYRLEGSDDGTTFRPLTEVPRLDLTGMRGRWVMLPGTETRFLRLGVAQAHGGAGVAEVQAFCQLPQPFPLPLPIRRSESGPPGWGDSIWGPMQLGLALAGLGLVLWEINLRKKRREDFLARARKAALLGLGVVAAGSYIHFGTFHSGQFLHHHDLAHYVLGARYFPELGYDDIYACATIADAEDGLGPILKLRRVRDLRSNLLVPAAQALEQSKQCHERFSGERWGAFKRDVAVFRSALGLSHWNDWFEDHGYNAPPAWMVVARPLLALGPSPLSHGFLVFLASLDLVLLLGGFALVGRAFGGRTLALALLVLGSNYAGDIRWIGGAFLRFDWLALCLAGVSLLKLKRPASAGFLLAYAAMLRVFPFFLLLGPLAKMIVDWRRAGRPEASDTRFAVGALAGLVLLFGLGAVVAGPSSYSGFASNTLKHGGTPLSNNMGLPVVLSYRPSQAARLVQNEGLRDPYSPWMDLRRQALHQMRPLQGLIALGAVGVFAAVSTSLPVWAGAALCASLAAFAPQLSCYYFAFLVIVALLYAHRSGVGVILLAFCAASQYLAWAPFSFMPVWYDDLYFVMSVLVIMALLAVAFLLRRSRPA